jgi:uncharacterized protein
MNEPGGAMPKLKCLTAVCLTAAVAAVLGCAPPPSGPPTPATPGGDLEPGPTAPPPALPTVTLPDGFRVTLELAITPEELAQGLMFRPRLAEDRGMLLIFPEERLPTIWMMNTLVALDLVYLDRGGTVVDVIPDAQPCPAEPCPRYVPKRGAQAVLELPAGTAAAHAVVEGAILDFERVPGFPEVG